MSSLLFDLTNEENSLCFKYDFDLFKKFSSFDFSSGLTILIHLRQDLDKLVTEGFFREEGLDSASTGLNHPTLVDGSLLISDKL